MNFLLFKIISLCLKQCALTILLGRSLQNSPQENNPEINKKNQDPLNRGIPKVRSGSGIIVLGAPVGYEAFVREALHDRTEKVRQSTELLPLLQDPHCEFVLLRSCLATPKVMFMLRALDTSQLGNLLDEFDGITRGALSKILGTPVSDIQWEQAKLPAAMGGLGLRSASDHGPLAFATSLLSVPCRIFSTIIRDWSCLLGPLVTKPSFLPRANPAYKKQL